MMDFSLLKTECVGDDELLNGLSMNEWLAKMYDMSSFINEAVKLNPKQVYVLLNTINEIHAKAVKELLSIEQTFADCGNKWSPAEKYFFLGMCESCIENYRKRKEPYCNTEYNLKKAAELGQSYGAYALADIYGSKDIALYLEWLSKAEEMGNKEAAKDLGDIYKNGWCCVDKNEDIALEHYMKAVEFGNSGVAYDLAEEYFKKFCDENITIKEDSTKNQYFNKAYELYQKAASLGNYFAGYKIASIDEIRKHEEENTNN